MLSELLSGDDLNERELEILQGAADGETAAKTGKRMHLAHETVKSYRKRAIAKLSAENITHAVAQGIRRGIIR